MHNVHIRNGNIFLRSWNGELQKDVEKCPDLQSLIPFLGCNVTIEGTTFGQFMDLIERDLDLIERLFESSTGGFGLRQYIDEGRLPGGDPERMEHVEVYWGAQVSRYEGKTDFEFFSGFHGWGPWAPAPCEEEPKEPFYCGYAIEWSPLNEYAALPLKLDTTVEIFDMDNPKAKPEKMHRHFTVYEVIHAIVFEITWSGDIAGRTARVNEIKRRANAAKEIMEDDEKWKRAQEEDLSDEEFLGPPEDPTRN